MLLLELFRDSPDLDVRLRGAHTWVQAGEHGVVPSAGPGPVVMDATNAKSLPQIRRTIAEGENPRRRDADYRYRIVVQANRSAKDRRVSRKLTPPKRIAKDRCRRGPRFTFVLSKTSSVSHREAEHWKEIFPYELRTDLLWLANAREAGSAENHGAHRVKAGSAHAPIQVVGGGNDVIRESTVRPGLPKHHQPVRVRIGQRLQNHCVDYAKHRRIGADSQGNHTNGDREKRRIEPKLSQRVQDVLEHETSSLSITQRLRKGLLKRIRH